MIKFLKMFLTATIIISTFLTIILSYFLVGSAPVQKNITWGVNFSEKGAESLKINWKEIYLAILDDLKVKKIKLLTHWDLVEREKDDYYFDDLDWQVAEAEKRGVKLIFALGIKTGRWPECHDPKWARSLPKTEEQAEVLDYVKALVLRYKYSSVIYAWQVENEPLVNFGECPWQDKDFWKKEIELVRSLDSKPIIATDSGENSFWFSAAKNSDIVGTTMYRRVWAHITNKLGFYVNLPYPPVYYWRKAQLIKNIFNKDVINTELQAEPWGRVPFYELSLKEQEKTMNETLFKSNIEYAKKTGLKEFYLWGAEWWYWMKEKQNKPQIWNEAKKLFFD